MKDLVALFDSLDVPAATGSGAVRFIAQPVEDFENYRVAKDVDGAPILLISALGGKADSRPNPIAIEHLAVQHDVECRISRLDGSKEEGRFTLVRCKGSDRILHIYFLRVANALMATLGEKPSQHAIAQSVNKLVELFRAMLEPSRKSVQGLWAEFLVIVRSPDPVALVSAWHTLPNDLYDFSQGDHRIEVKSATGRIRRHHFSLEQLCPPQGTKVLVASVLVERAGGGVSLADLVDQVRARVSHNPDLLLHMDYTVGLCLGENWRAAIEDRFDRELAVNSLTFFDASTIPAPRVNVPAEVTNVSFVSDLSQTPRADLAALRASGGLFKSALR